MSEVLAVTTPIYLVILAGFAAVRSGYLPAAVAEMLGAFVLKICLPLLVFSAVARGGEMHWPFVLAYGAGSLATLLIGMAVLRALGERGAGAVMGGLGMSMSNSAFLGYPLILATFGAIADRAFPWVLMVENVLMLPLCLILADAAGAEGRGIGRSLAGVARRTMSNPILIGLAAGLVAAALDLRLPGFVDRAVTTLRAAAPGTALFVVGALAAGLEVRRLGAPVFAVAAGKLLLHPLLVLAAFAVMPGIGREAWAAGLVFAACAMVGIFPILGARYGVGGRAAAAFILATGASFVTTGIAIWIALSA